MLREDRCLQRHSNVLKQVWGSNGGKMVKWVLTFGWRLINPILRVKSWTYFCNNIRYIQQAQKSATRNIKNNIRDATGVPILKAFRRFDVCIIKVYDVYIRSQSEIGLILLTISLVLRCNADANLWQFCKIPFVLNSGNRKLDLVEYSKEKQTLCLPICTRKGVQVVLAQSESSAPCKAISGSRLEVASQHNGAFFNKHITRNSPPPLSSPGESQTDYCPPQLPHQPPLLPPQSTYPIKSLQRQEGNLTPRSKLEALILATVWGWSKDSHLFTEVPSHEKQTLGPCQRIKLAGLTHTNTHLI